MKPKLVLIEWEDSAQPVPGWAWLDELEDMKAVRCRSVGWLIQDDAKVKALAPNLGCVLDEDWQVSGVIRIPARCVTRLVEIDQA